MRTLWKLPDESQHPIADVIRDPSKRCSKLDYDAVEAFAKSTQKFKINGIMDALALQQLSKEDLKFQEEYF